MIEAPLLKSQSFTVGLQQGRIRVPEGRRGTGWALFEKELRRYFLNEKPSQMGSSAVGRQRLDGDHINPGRKRDLGKGIDNGYGSTGEENNRPKLWAHLMADAPRPTRRYDFVWKPRYKTLRITIIEAHLGLVDQLEIHTRPSPALEDQNGVASSSKLEFISSTRPMALSDDDLETVDDSSGSEEDGLATTEAGRELVVCTFEGVVLHLFQLAWSTRHESERTQSPLVCQPLAKIAPMGFSEFTDQYSGDVLALEEAMSLWVEEKYRDFGVLVGMPIAGFEAECIALLRRIDAERKKGRQTPGPRKPTKSTKKGGPFTWSSGLSLGVVARNHLQCLGLIGFWCQLIGRITFRMLARSFYLVLFLIIVHCGWVPEKIQGWWSSYSFSGPPSLVLARKLKALKEDFKIWNREVFGDVGVKKKGVMDDILRFDEKEFQGVLSDVERNRVQVIEVDGASYDVEANIRVQMVLFYTNLYQEGEGWRPDVDGLPFASIGEEDCHLLERNFDKEEVCGVLRDLRGDKAPGPDGFTMAFFQHCWQTKMNSRWAGLRLSKCFCGWGHLMVDFVLIANECLDSRLKKWNLGYPFGKAGFELVFLQLVSRSWLMGPLQQAEGCGFIRGFKVNGSRTAEVCISHLLYADDTMLMCDADPKQLMYIWLVLSCFEAATGLRVNLAKNEMVPIGNVGNLAVLVDILCCRISQLPMNYLGMPLGSSFKALSIWNPIIEKMERRLAGWQRLYISKGGRLTLLKSTHSSLPTYYLSLFTIPVSVAKRLEKFQRTFLWGGSGEDPKHSLVKWDTICSPIDKGGLGIRLLVPLNRALLGKWLWRFVVEGDRLWRRVVASRHGAVHGGWGTGQVRGSYGCGLWKGIMLG
uniref:Reverse transcriptase domain-containing protein n=1 Tax=Fagus sylvatica TaxID=28930 RepID=A0A2N9FLS3_FAGSY